jgi:hypothetical protein
MALVKDSAEAAWLYGPIIAGVFGLLGALLGALLGVGSALLATYLADRRRFKYEDKHRDYPDRQRAYADFLTSWHAYEEAKTILGDEGRKALDKAELQFQRSYNLLSLLAPEEVRKAADDLRREAHGAADGEAADGPSKRKEGPPGRFWKAARKDLGKELPRPLGLNGEQER